MTHSKRLIIKGIDALSKKISHYLNQFYDKGPCQNNEGKKFINCSENTSSGLWHGRKKHFKID
jgi:hypothetical protein